MFEAQWPSTAQREQFTEHLAMRLKTAGFKHRSSRTVGFCVGHGSVPRPVAERDFVLWPALHRGAIGLQRDEIVADGGNLLDQVLPGRIVPAVNGVGVVGHAGHLARLDNGQGRAERNRYFL